MEDSYVLQLTDRKFSDLFLTCCGYSVCHPDHSFGPAVRPNYMIHFVLSGQGIYRSGDTTYHLKEGQGFLIQPHIQTYYQADCSDPWTYLWIGFDGRNACEYLSDLGLNSRQLIFQCSNSSDLQETVYQMLKHNTCTISDQFCLQGLLYRFFSILTQKSSVEFSSSSSGENYYVKKAVEFIQNNYFRPIKITDIASYVCINRSYLYTLFHRYLDTSPQEYLSNYRITCAAELLMTTALSIQAVALSCGYEDALVFSKNFKARKGIPPSRYREDGRRASQEKLEHASFFPPSDPTQQKRT